MSPAVASARLEALVEAAFQAALNWKAEVEGSEASAPGVGIAASAGLGKTEAVLGGLVRHGKALLASGHVVLYLPTLELAEQAHDRFLAKQPGLPSFVLRGRLAADPGRAGMRTCDRADLVKEAQRHLAAIGGSFCKAERPDGTIVTAPCFATCRYYAQFEGRSHSVVFTSHG